MNDLRRVVENTLVPHTAFAKATNSLAQCFEYALDSAEPVCLAILGESRTGKSRALEEHFVLHPKNRTPDGLVVPILRVKTPSKPTVKSLVELMLTAIGDPLPPKTKESENQKTNRLHQLMRATSTRMLMVDEFQHFVDKGNRKVLHHTADWLKVFADEAKVALVISGIPSCRAVLDQNEQLAGRFMAPIIMPRFDWQNDDHREEFIAILSAFHEAMACNFDLPQLDSDEMAFRLYCASGGLMGYLVKILRQAVWDTLDADARSITIETFAASFETSVWATNSIIGFRPFDRGFTIKPDEKLMAAVRQIGVKADEPPQARKGKPISKGNVTPNYVFAPQG